MCRQARSCAGRLGHVQAGRSRHKGREGPYGYGQAMGRQEQAGMYGQVQRQTRPLVAVRQKHTHTQAWGTKGSRGQSGQAHGRLGGQQHRQGHAQRQSRVEIKHRGLKQASS